MERILPSGLWLPIIVACILAMTPMRSSQAAASIVGVWQRYDEDTHEPQAEIEITEHGGVFEGRVVKLFLDAGDPPNPVCNLCRGARKNQPIKGMRVIENVRRNGGAYDGGTAVDPEDGSVYKVKLVPSDDGRTLSVTGYIGVSLLGQTQTWTRLR
jgi:uncharacterized protein (DUF2147 family)